ncbi:TetR/AcrR family transcriptional regulator C-terminal domain-containing protein [Streptosporangium sp. NPDC048047]|uniref:TetR/AcrR family transcriptional regulator C-terminal domain-containing protein n=1 Tax=Streptosporangium sp. NPDC048047 TaxID=3155748 RepID=UPI00342396BE
MPARTSAWASVSPPSPAPITSTRPTPRPVIPPPGAPPPDGPWDARLRGVAIGLREVMLAHRDGARLMSGFHEPSAEAVAAFHRLIESLIAAGVPADTAAVAVDTVLAYVNGYTVEEQARKSGSDAWPREDLDRAFRGGLELILTGVRASLHGATAADRPPSPR